MKAERSFIRLTIIAASCFAVGTLFTSVIYGDDSIRKGTIVQDFNTALNKGDVAPIFKYAKQDDQEALRKAFNQILTEEKKDPQLKERLKQIFIDMLVRMNSEKEKTPYDAGLVTSEGVYGHTLAIINNALNTGASEIKLTRNASIASGINERFSRLLEKKKHRNDNLEASNEFRQAFIELANYIETKYLSKYSTYSPK